MISSNRRIRSLLSATAMLLAASCIDSAPPDSRADSNSTSPIESWEKQVAHVRDGGSRTISFARAAVTRDQWAKLTEGCANLVVLEFDARDLTIDDLGVLADLPGLKRLKLVGPVDDAALQKVSSAVNLTAINLPHGQFTDEGLAVLASLEKLELLRFGSPQVSDEGLAIISRLPSLRFLHLIDVPITDAGLLHLHGMEQLESLYLDGGHCTDEGLRKLLHSLPELHFHQDQLHLPDDPLAHPHD